MKNLQRLSGFFIALLLSMQAWAAPDYWIDVRTLVEYSLGHVDDAAHIPYDDIGEDISTLTTDKNAEIYLYCRSGGRAGKAKATLESLGYTRVTNVGGLDDAKALIEQDGPR